MKVVALLSLAAAIGADAQFQGGFQPYGLQQPFVGQPYGVSQPYLFQQPFQQGYAVPQPYQPVAPAPLVTGSGSQFCAQPGTPNRCGQSNRGGQQAVQTPSIYGQVQPYGVPSIYGNQNLGPAVPSVYGNQQQFGVPYGVPQPYGVAQPSFGGFQPYAAQQPVLFGRRLAQFQGQFNGGLIGGGFPSQGFSPFQTIQPFQTPFQQNPFSVFGGRQCQCDTQCQQFGDCCPDYAFACRNPFNPFLGTTPLPTAQTPAPTAAPANSAAPTTKAPTTAAPTTKAPTKAGTNAPTTKAPTTFASTNTAAAVLAAQTILCRNGCLTCQAQICQGCFVKPDGENPCCFGDTTDPANPKSNCV